MSVVIKHQSSRNSYLLCKANDMSCFDLINIDENAITINKGQYIYGGKKGNFELINYEEDLEKKEKFNEEMNEKKMGIKN